MERGIKRGGSWKGIFATLPLWGTGQKPMICLRFQNMQNYGLRHAKAALSLTRCR